MGGAADAKKAPFGSSLVSVFMHADAADVALMVLGLVGAIGDGVSTPAMNARNLVFLALGCWVMAFLEGYCWSRTAERQASRMRARYLAAVLRQDVEYFDLKVGSTAEVIASVSNDSLVVQDVLSEKVPNFVMNAAMFFGSYAVALALLWRLTLVALPSVLLLIIPGFMYGRILIGLARRIREQYTRPGAVAEQAISSVRTVYSFAAERATMAQFSAALEESRCRRSCSSSSPASCTAASSSASRAGSGSSTRARAPSPSRPSRRFCLRVPAGRTAALVGSSGSGKSTVVALLERFYDPLGGEVALDGVDIRRLRLKWLRAQMGLVSQEPALFATSIMENILFGKEDATPDEVTAAAKAANAHNFISQLPQGYDTQFLSKVKSEYPIDYY
uniref:Putative multidrug resistance protein n=1 Tax=Aegilops tauschii TaxID=37682 RepID=M8B7L8_AEGTA